MVEREMKTPPLLGGAIKRGGSAIPTPQSAGVTAPYKPMPMEAL